MKFLYKALFFSKTHYAVLLLSIGCLLTGVNQLIYHYEPSSDSLRYIALAEQYRDLHFFEADTNCYGHSFYAFFLLIIGSLFSYHPFAIGIAQSLLYSVVLLLLLSELQKYSGRNLKVAGLFMVLLPEIQLFNGYILTESLSFTFVLLSYYLGLKIVNAGASISRLLLLSLVLGLSIFNRIETLVILLPLIYFIYPTIRNRFAVNLCFLIAGTVFFLLLNGYRNWRTYHIFKVSSFNGGEVVYGGNNFVLDGSHHNFWEHKSIYFPEDEIPTANTIMSKNKCESCPENDAFLMSLARKAWKEKPLDQLKVIPYKLAKNWLLPGQFDIYTGDTTGTKGLQLMKLFDKKIYKNIWYAPYKHGLYVLLHYVILLVIALGIFQARPFTRLQKSVLIFFGCYLLFAIPFCGLPRWHVTLLPLLFLVFYPTQWTKQRTEQCPASPEHYN